jgi:protein-L-isoaspartate(D-aspartate) O-methyltransferase
MVTEQLEARGIRDKRVLEAMRRVPRHLFVEEALTAQAYGDYPLPIGERQTISQPYIVAQMTEELGLKGPERVLEVGTGSGYQTAILACLTSHVYTIEWHEKLMTTAAARLAELGLNNVTYRCADGSLGWPERAPFDAILVTAGAPDVPKPLCEQLADGGRLVVPIGPVADQTLVRVRKTGGELQCEDLMKCRFVKLFGEAGWRE